MELRAILIGKGGDDGDLLYERRRECCGIATFDSVVVAAYESQHAAMGAFYRVSLSSIMLPTS